MTRYNRHIILSEVGPQGQAKLNAAKVLVIGVGGLGCPVLQYLAAAGIGTLGIVDFDIVETSNLQRQVLFGTSDLRQNKALAAKRRLSDLNPEILIRAYPYALKLDNASELFSAYDIIVDGSDNFATRYLVNDTAIWLDKPLVYGALFKFEGQLSVFNYNDGPSYRCLFPEPPKAGSTANCNEVGVLGVVPGIIGSMMANEVIKIILGFDGVLSGKLLCYDARTARTVSIKVTRTNLALADALLQKADIQNDYKNGPCSDEIREILASEISNPDKVQFIDVREVHEKPDFEALNCIRIPLKELTDHLDQIGPERHHILVCQTGVRSKTAVEILQNHNIDNCYSLKGGVHSILEHLKQKI